MQSLQSSNAKLAKGYAKLAKVNAKIRFDKRKFIKSCEEAFSRGPGGEGPTGG